MAERGSKISELERHKATEKWEKSKKQTVIIEPACTCARWPFPHIHPDGKRRK